MTNFWRRGEHCVWGTAAALTLTLLLALVLIVVVIVNGLGVFWPSAVAEAQLADGSRLMGEVIRREPVYRGEGERLQFKVGNRELYGLDFRWVDESDISRLAHPDNAVVLEREEYGNFYGRLLHVETAQLTDAAQLSPWEQLEAAHRYVEEQTEGSLSQIAKQLSRLNAKTSGIRARMDKLIYLGVADEDEAMRQLQEKQLNIDREFNDVVVLQAAQVEKLSQVTATFVDASGTEQAMAVANIVRFYRPNQMPLWQKAAFYAGKLYELIFGEPRESNTEGGLFPAIFGTVTLIFIMSLLSFPLGVVAAIYLREYAKEGVVVRLVRIAVNNLAGIPSIVYGIFGLAFFVYGIGGSIDRMFFPERLPTPTFGTGGILWASLTLGLLTVPVVIVATEEALGAIPQGVREGSLALGATKLQTLVRTLLPMASPGIMTGLILAMARAAGEVAPLMITGVVKLAPALPIDGTFPFVHLDRKFMHLGFHIYDIGFQSPNVEAAKPMVFVTTLLLVLIVLAMSSVAIYLRNKMKKRYSYRTF
ncbi:phosphate ABC transporter, permease protein PstA [Syntrophotalea acetylenivorans]|uniref:Phosphate transport system permease protein PstA n=1 Tax=Syntrophotalea acetylenivorans TaxID=1842532 RepID=A0A1L3GP83_9BACT|nr:phosphate ABC transporter permease PstA [Syntrophotalea acetylenivorans]APG27739.1 phosphate ABC transporter, permease protein PstA [Syntrophotalea acetylenivorans]